MHEGLRHGMPIVRCDVSRCKKKAEVEVRFWEDGHWWPYCRFHSNDRGSLRWSTAVAVKAAEEGQEVPSWA